MRSKIIVQDRDHLKKLIEAEIKRHGDVYSLNHLDVSNITDMSHMFASSPFKGDINKWNVSRVKNTKEMFFNSIFKGNIAKWNVSSVTDMTGMFMHARFNGDISKWDVSHVKDTSRMFWNSDYKKDLTNWCPYKLEIKDNMFNDGANNHPYWYTAHNTQKAIKSYQLKNQLETQLASSDIAPKKIKI